jgi:hypothetical protein
VGRAPSELADKDCFAGEEVVERHCALPKSADERMLRNAVEKTVRDEGYEVDATALVQAL